MHATELDLIPVRALNQVTYCHRLYYLEYVESVMPINEHVEVVGKVVEEPDVAARPLLSGELVGPPYVPTLPVVLSGVRVPHGVSSGGGGESGPQVAERA